MLFFGYLSTHPIPLASTALHGLEVRNAVKLGVFRGLSPASAATAALANLEKDLRRGRLVRTAVKWPLAFRFAARMSERHTITTGNRSLDVLHVAVARSLRATDFISFDLRQRALAVLAGLKVAP